MQAYQERVIEEKTALDKKIADLTTFLQGRLFGTLDRIDRELLLTQHEHMASYSATLEQRIARFIAAEETTAHG